MDETHHRFTTWVPVELNTAVRQVAHERGESIVAFVVRALQTELDRVGRRRRRPSRARPRT